MTPVAKAGDELSIRWGILSTARINQKILAGARASALIEIIAVGARDQARAEAYARENGIERAYGSYEELLADPAVDAVYVSVPNALHTEWSIRAVEAGKHVLCEKPLSRHVSEVVAAFDAAERNGRLLMEGLMYRHHPQTAALSAALASGAIGDLRLMRMVYGYNLLRTVGDDETNVRLSLELAGGVLQDLGCYCVSAARLLAGEPESVYAVHRLGESGVDILSAATLEFESGVVAQFECSFSIEPRVEFEVLGTEGRLVVREPFRIEHPGIELWGPKSVEMIDCEPGDPYQLELENLSEAILDDAEPLLGRVDALGQARTLEALFESATQGVPISLASFGEPVVH